MQAKGVHSFTAEADVLREKWHHGMKSQGVGEEVLIAGIEVHARNCRRIEGQVHVRQAGADELSIDSGVMREGRAKDEVSFIELISQVVLFFESFGVSANSPKLVRVVQSRLQAGNRYANGVGDVSGEFNVAVLKEKENAWASFCPRREVADVLK